IMGFAAPMENDGTVVLSDYHKNIVTNHYWFTFTTMATLYDGTHPVSGNRRFGIVPHPGGGWQFYVTGVDRCKDLFMLPGFMQESAFTNADELWEKIQQNLVGYINTHQGNSILSPSKKVRVPWEGTLKLYLKGEININLLKAMLHCL